MVVTSRDSVVGVARPTLLKACRNRAHRATNSSPRVASSQLPDEFQRVRYCTVPVRRRSFGAASRSCGGTSTPYPSPSSGTVAPSSAGRSNAR